MVSIHSNRYWKGKLIGGCVGSLGGLYGVALGVLVGHLLDRILEQRYLGRAVQELFSNPFQSPLAAQAEGVFCEFTLICQLFFLQRKNPLTFLDELIERYPAAGRVPKKEYRVFKEIASSICLDLLDPDVALLIGFLKNIREGHTFPELFHTLLTATGISSPQELTRGGRELMEEAAYGWGVEVDEFRRLLGENDSSTLQNPWKLLGLTPDATLEEIKRVYRSLAASFHPDAVVGLSEEQQIQSEEAFKRIRHAYEACILRCATAESGLRGQKDVP